MKKELNHKIYCAFKGDDIIETSESIDDVIKPYDYGIWYSISVITYKKICTGDYHLKTYGNTVRAYCN